MAVNVAKMRKKLHRWNKDKERRQSGGRFWRPEDGENRIRILPPKRGDEFCLEYMRHFGILKRPVPCPQSIGKRCPAHEVTAKLFKSRRSGDIELAKRLAGKRTFVTNIIDRNGDPNIPLVWEFGPQIYEQLLSYFADDEWGDITDGEKGYDVKIEKSGEGLDTSYQVKVAKNPSKLKNWRKLMSKAQDIEEFVEYPSAHEMETMLEGDYEEAKEEDADEEEEDEEGEEEEKKVKKGKKSKSSKKSKKDDDDEEEEDEEEDEEEEEEDDDEDAEEEKPSKKKKKSKKSKAKDEDD